MSGYKSKDWKNVSENESFAAFFFCFSCPINCLTTPYAYLSYLLTPWWGPNPQLGNQSFTILMCKCGEVIVLDWAYLFGMFWTALVLFGGVIYVGKLFYLL